MGARKHIVAEKLKEARKKMYFAKLNGVPSSPRKMRYVVDMIRGLEVNRALGVLRFSKKQAAADVEKLLRSAIANWETKNDRKAEDGELYVSKVLDRKSTRLNSSHANISYAVFCLKKNTKHANILNDDL